MSYKYFLVFTLAFLLSSSFAQNDSARKANDTIVINKDPRLDILTHKQTVFNKRAKMMTRNGLYKGYRLQILNTNDRTKAFKVKYDLLTNFPNEKTYVSYQSPFFKVKFGNFLQRADAEKMRKQLMKIYTEGVFIVDDTIEYIPKDEEDIK